MTNRALLREIWRDMTSGTAWIGLWTLVVAVLLGGGIGLDLQVIARESIAAQEYQNAMANVRIVESPEAIDGATCQSLAGVEGVFGAIAIREASEKVASAALPSSSLQTWEYTGNAEGVFDMTSYEGTGRGIVLSEQVADTLGLRAGDELPLTSGESAYVQGVYAWDESDGRRAGYAYSALVAVPPQGTFDACWVRMWPTNPHVDALMRLSVIPSSDNQRVDMSSVNSSLGTSFDGPQRFSGRITAPIAWVLFGGGLAIGALFVRRRRLECASDLHAGVAKADIVAKLMAHTSVIIAAAALWVVPAYVWVTMRVAAGDRAALWAQAGLLGAVCAVSLLLGTFVTALTLKEKKLFDYFKTR